MSTQLDNLIETFDFLDDWEQKYQYIMELGEQLEAPSATLRQNIYKVHGCVSQVWIRAHRRADGRIQVEGDSETPIIKGIVALLISLTDGSLQEDIQALDFDDLFLRLGLDKNLSPSRHIGVYAITELLKSQVNELVAG